jgi:hypothetical protein
MKSLSFFIILIHCLSINAAAQDLQRIADTLVTIDRQNYSIQCPANWTIDTSKTLGADLFIFSPKTSETDNFRENVNVMIQSLQGFNVTLDQYVEVSENQIKTGLTNGKIIESKKLTRGPLTFHKLTYSGTQGIFTLKGQQYYFLHRETAYVITFTADNNNVQTFEEIGEAVLNSFKIKE